MSDNNINRFFQGICVGMIVSCIVLYCIGRFPTQIDKQYESKAVSLGYGQYVIDTNHVTVKFEWIEKK